MFTSIKNLINGLFNDIKSTFITLFAIGFMFCGIMVWTGAEENAPKFKKGAMFCALGAGVFLLAKPILTYIDKYL